MHRNIHTYTSTHTGTHMHVRTHSHVLTPRWLCSLLHIYTYIYIDTYTHIHIYMYVYIYIHICVCVSKYKDLTPTHLPHGTPIPHLHHNLPPPSSSQVDSDAIVSDVDSAIVSNVDSDDAIAAEDVCTEHSPTLISKTFSPPHIYIYMYIYMYT